MGSVSAAFEGSGASTMRRYKLAMVLCRASETTRASARRSTCCHCGLWKFRCKPYTKASSLGECCTMSLSKGISFLLYALVGTPSVHGYPLVFNLGYAQNSPDSNNVFLRVPVYAGVTQQGGLGEPKDSMMYYFTRQANLQRSSVGRAGTGPVERRQSRAERLATLTYEEILHTKVAFGTAAGLIDRLGQMQDELGLDCILAELNAGGQILPERVKRSLHILTHEVMPAFK